MEVEAHKHNKRPRQKHIEQINKETEIKRFGLKFSGMSMSVHT